MGGKVSTYGDVYSYGILLLEMFTGKRPVDGLFKDGLNLHSYAKMALPDRIVEVVDPLLVREIRSVDSSDEMDLYHVGSHEIFACLMTIIKMGVACSVELPRERMDIGDVVTELNRIKDTLLGTRMRA
jgi:serine/threonine protein kinase